MSNKYCITISRQFGSMGRPIGMKLAEELGISFYDRNIVEEAASKLGLSLKLASDLEEREKSGFMYMMHPLGTGRSKELQEKLFCTEAQVIREYAARESCVIVGRCSDYLLMNEKNHINFYIFAPYAQRLKNCVERLHMTEDEAQRMISRVDSARDAYHKRYTRFKQEDLEYNNVMVDSSLLGIEGTARMLADIVKMKFPWAFSGDEPQTNIIEMKGTEKAFPF